MKTIRVQFDGNSHRFLGCSTLVARVYAMKPATLPGNLLHDSQSVAEAYYENELGGAFGQASTSCGSCISRRKDWL